MHIKAFTKSQGDIHVLNTGGGAIVFFLWKGGVVVMVYLLKGIQQLKGFKRFKAINKQK